MKCPYCGEEMKSGFIYGCKDAGLLWYPAEEKMPLVITEMGVQKHGGMLLGEQPGLKNTKLEFHICSNCKKGISNL